MALTPARGNEKTHSRRANVAGRKQAHKNGTLARRPESVPTPARGNQKCPYENLGWTGFATPSVTLF